MLSFIFSFLKLTRYVRKIYYFELNDFDLNIARDIPILPKIYQFIIN